LKTRLRTHPAAGLPVDEGDWDARPLDTLPTADTLAEEATEAPGEVLWLKLTDDGGVPICVELRDALAAGDAPCESVALPLAVRAELDVAAGEPLGDRLEVPDGEAGGAALDDEDCVVD